MAPARQRTRRTRSCISNDPPTRDAALHAQRATSPERQAVPLMSATASTGRSGFWHIRPYFSTRRCRLGELALQPRPSSRLDRNPRLDGDPPRSKPGPGRNAPTSVELPRLGRRPAIESPPLDPAPPRSKPGLGRKAPPGWNYRTSVETRRRSKKPPRWWHRASVETRPPVKKPPPRWWYLASVEGFACSKPSLRNPSSL